MEDQLVTLEVAKLAKEKGFNISLYDFWYQDKISGKPYITQGTEYDSERYCKWDWNLNGGESGNLLKVIPYPNNPDGIYYSAPTQSLLQKWLREIHNIDIFCDCIGNKLYYSVIYNNNEKQNDKVFEQENPSSYEDALKIGLIGALKLIKSC